MKAWSTIPVLACAALLSGSSVWAQSASTPWELRVSGLQTEFYNHSDAFSFGNPGFPFGSDAFRLDKKTTGGVSVTRMLESGFALEISYVAPAKRNVSAIGSGVLGTVETSQTAATVQYHFKTISALISPYVGVGFGNVQLSKQNLRLFSTSIFPVSTSSNASGTVLQLGLNVHVSNTVSLNVDYKYLNAKADLRNGANNKLTTLKLDPLVYGVGLGFHF